MFTSCATWREALVREGNHTDAIHNAIIDFVNTNRLSKKDSIFYVILFDKDTTIWGVEIIGSDGEKLYPTPENKIGTNYPYFPTDYFEYKGKLFYWYDSTKYVTEELIKVLSKYDLIDSLNVDSIVAIPTLFIDDAKKAVDYYFCRNNLLKYKKVTTRIAIGWYEPPKLRCKK